MIKDKDIDKLFREKLRDYEQQPPAYLLESVLAGVAAAKRKRKIVFWRIAGVAAALLLAFIAGWQVNYLNDENLNQPVVVSRDSSTKSFDAKNAVAKKEAIQNITQEAKTEKGKTTSGNGVPRLLTADDTADSATSETADKISLGKSAQLATRVNQPETTDLVNEGPDHSPWLHPLKTISRLIERTDQFANRLHEKKANTSNALQAELTIDQQIIEQNEEKLRLQNDKSKSARWLVGAQVSPAYSVNRSNHSSQYASTMLNSSSNTPVELGGGLSVEYKPGKRWSIQSGVYYAGLGESSGNSGSSARSLDFLASNGSEYFNAPVNIVANNMMLNSTAGVIELKGVPTGMELGTNLEDKTMASTVVLSDARFIQNFQYLEIPL